MLKLEREVKICRNELKNLRDAIHSLKTTHQKNVKVIRNLIEGSTPALFYPENEKLEMQLYPIGYIKSLFKAKNGIPHQSNVCPISRCQLKVEKSAFTNPHHSLIGLEQYSHIWIIFIFHKNQQGDKYQRFTKAKVKPPRLDGRTVGVFATRSPHRPNPIGLTLTRLEKVEDDTLYLSGVDLLDGTPVVDIKPYIPNYDIPKSPSVDIIKDHMIHKKESDMIKEKSIDCPRDESSSQLMIHTPTETNFISDSLSQIHLPQPSDLSSELPPVNVATWIVQPVIAKLVVVFSKRAETDLKKFHKKDEHEEECPFCLEFLKCPEECIQIIQQLLQNDPRSIYRRNSCCDKLYYFSVDKLHITAWFDDSENITEVLRVLPLENRKWDTQTPAV